MGTGKLSECIALIQGHPTRPVNMRVSGELLDRVANRAAKDGFDRPWIIKILLAMYATGMIEIRDRESKS